MVESDIQASIMLAATRAGHRLFRNNQGVASYVTKSGKRSKVRYGLGVGSWDLVGWSREGYFIGIEVKQPGERPRRDQGAWNDAAVRSCPTLRCGWADNVEDAMRICEGSRATGRGRAVQE